MCTHIKPIITRCRCTTTKYNKESGWFSEPLLSEKYNIMWVRLNNYIIYAQVGLCGGRYVDASSRKKTHNDSVFMMGWKKKKKRKKGLTGCFYRPEVFRLSESRIIRYIVQTQVGIILYNDSSKIYYLYVFESSSSSVAAAPNSCHTRRRRILCPRRPNRVPCRARSLPATRRLLSRLADGFPYSFGASLQLYHVEAIEKERERYIYIYI